MVLTCRKYEVTSQKDPYKLQLPSKARERENISINKSNASLLFIHIYQAK